jgi:membrane protease YdiL (CAAX protease family)
MAGLVPAIHRGTGGAGNDLLRNLGAVGMAGSSPAMTGGAAYRRAMRRNAWTIIGLGLALVGPGVIAWATQPARGPIAPAASAFWLAVFCVLLAGVAATARFGERLTPRQIGFARTSWRSVPLAIIVALAFVFGYFPLADLLLGHSATGSFDAGRRALAALPTWYLGVTIVIVASGEEWLYRAYAIERLAELTGSTGAAAVIALLMFGIVHLPLWGLGAALSTIIPGAIFTALYLWRRDIVALALAHVLIDLHGLVVLALDGQAAS